ncbi:MAG: class II aldolase/adducin family protein [Methanimicrococcus sp.]|nr:class II aldolase/adducin family protein [Methanimicrococcus sp.]
MWQNISAIGKKVVTSGLVEANFGNISVRSASGNSFVITKTKTALDEIQRDSVIEVPIEEPNEAPVETFAETPDFDSPEYTMIPKSVFGAIEKTASSETRIHRRIYQKTKAKAILHAHCPYSVVMSILEFEKGNTEIIPIDSEGKLFLKRIPIVEGGIGSEELAKNAAKAFEDDNIKGVVVLGHGTIAAGETLEEAYYITAQLEHAAKIKYMYEKA